MNLLPHRYPMLLVDKVVESYVHWTKALHAIKNVTFNEPIFTGHFPTAGDFPRGVDPRSTWPRPPACWVSKWLEDSARDELYLFAAIDKARFKRPVVPGDTMNLHIDVR